MLLVPLVRRWAIIIAIIFMVISVFYTSKPDRGGLIRCQKIFGFSSLNNRGLTLQPFLKWKPFETPKFRMSIESGKLNSVKDYLAKFGYTEWTLGGLQYGSLNMGWDSSTDLYYSKKRIGKNVQIVAYDETNNLLYAIVSQ